MARDLGAVKDYMRFGDQDLTEDEAGREESVIEALIAGAEEYLLNAGIPAPGPDEASELYDLCVKAMVLHWYDHRDDVGDEPAMPNGVRRAVTQLKLVCGARRAAGGGS